MLTFGLGEIFIVFVIIIVVIRPKELPYLIKQLTSFAKSIRKLSSDFKVYLKEITDHEGYREAKTALNEVNKIKSDLDIKDKFQSEIEAIKETGAINEKETKIINKIDIK